MSNNIEFPVTNTPAFNNKKADALRMITAFETLLKGCRNKGIKVDNFKKQFQELRQYANKSPDLVSICMGVAFKEIKDSKKINQEFIKEILEERLETLRSSEQTLGKDFADGAKTFSIPNQQVPDIIFQISKQSPQVTNPKSNYPQIQFADLKDDNYPTRIIIKRNGKTGFEKAKSQGAGATHNLHVSGLKAGCGIHLLRDKEGKVFLSNIKELNSSKTPIIIEHDGDQKHTMRPNEIVELKQKDIIKIGDTIEILIRNFNNVNKIYLFDGSDNTNSEIVIKDNGPEEVSRNSLVTENTSNNPEKTIWQVGISSDDNVGVDGSLLNLLESPDDNNSPGNENPFQFNESFRLPSKVSPIGTTEISDLEIRSILEEIQGLDDSAIMQLATDEIDANNENSFVSEIWLGSEPRNINNNQTGNFDGDEIYNNLKSTVKMRNLGNYKDIKQTGTATVMGETTVSQPVISMEIPSCNNTVSGLHGKLRLDTKGDFWFQNTSKSNTLIRDSVEQALNSGVQAASSEKFEKLKQGQILKMGGAELGIDPANRRFYIYAPNNVTGESSDENFYYYTLNERGVPILSKIGKFNNHTDLIKDFFSTHSVKKNVKRAIFGNAGDIFKSMIGKFFQIKEDIGK